MTAAKKAIKSTQEHIKCDSVSASLPPPCESLKTLQNDSEAIDATVIKTDSPDHEDKALKQIGDPLIDAFKVSKGLSETFSCKQQGGKPECQDLADLRKALVDAGKELLPRYEKLIAKLAALVSANASPDATQKIADANMRFQTDAAIVPEHYADNTTAKDSQHLSEDTASRIDIALTIIDNTSDPNTVSQIKTDLSALKKAIQTAATPDLKTQPAGKVTGNSVVQHESEPNSSLPWLAVALNLLALGLLLAAWVRNSRPSVSSPAAVKTSDTMDQRLKELEGAARSQLSRFSELSVENTDLREELEAKSKQLASRTSELQTLRQSLKELEKDPEDDKQNYRPETVSRSEQLFPPKAGSVLTAAKTEKSQPKTDEDFTGSLVRDYNQARQEGHDAEDRFKAQYGPAKGMVCEDLAVIKIEGGRPTFREDSRAAYFFSVTWQGKRCLLPQFTEFRFAQNMMDGIFKYPSGSSENLRLKEPAYLINDRGGWILQTPGEFVDAG